MQVEPIQEEGDAQASGEAPRVPPVGSLERKEILETLRQEVQPTLNGRAVLFKVIQLDVLDGWAFVRAQPQQPGGIPMDYRGTEFQREVEDGAFEDQVVALLRSEANNWEVTKWGFGGTDVYWLHWDKTYGAPSEIFRPF